MAQIDQTPALLEFKQVKGITWKYNFQLIDSVTQLPINLSTYNIVCVIENGGAVLETLHKSEGGGITLSGDNLGFTLRKDWVSWSNVGIATPALSTLPKGMFTLKIILSGGDGVEISPIFLKIEVVDEATAAYTEDVSLNVYKIFVANGFALSVETFSILSELEAINEDLNTPFSSERIADEAITPAKTSFLSEDEYNPDILTTGVDEEDNMLYTIFKNGKLLAIFDYALSKITYADLATDVVAILNSILEKIPQDGGKFVSKGLSVTVDDDDNLLSEYTDEGKFRAIFDYALSKISYADLASDVVAILNSILEKIPQDGGKFVSKGLSVTVDDNDNLLSEYTDEGKLRAIFDYALSKITYADLASDVVAKFDYLSNNIAFEIDGRFEKYMRVYIDEEDNIIYAQKKDGKFVTDIELMPNSIEEFSLTQELRDKIPSASFILKNSYNAANVEFADDDDLWRAVEVELPVKTHRTGIAFSRFSTLKTSSIRGVNNTGFYLEFRLGPYLTIRGENLRKVIIEEVPFDFTPILSSKLATYKGRFYDSAVSLPSTPIAGDYHICVFSNGNPQTRTLSGVTMSQWDILYYDGTNWQIQPCPVTASTLKPGDYFDVISNGKFWNIELKEGDRLIFLGRNAGSGYDNPIWVKQKQGEFFWKGECNPATFSVVSPKNYDLYVVSTDGNYSGIDLKKGDYLFRLEGVWGKSEGNVVTVNNNAAFNFACTNAKQISVRRADKSTTQLTIKAKANVNMLSREVSDSLLLISDSMFGVRIGGAIASILSPRTCVVQSFGGASSDNVLAMYKYFIRNSDAYKNFKPVFFHGQNNSGDITQIKNATLEMISLAGSQQSDFVIWSMLGQLEMSFNGTRMVCSNHEDSFQQVQNKFVEIENWYDAVITHRHFATRKAALASAVGRTRKSLHFPGMTEEQVAISYGIPPFSYFFNFSAVSWNPDNLVFAGYYSTTALPSNIIGSDFNYYIRTGGVADATGNLIVKVSGIWTEYSYDDIHVTQEGANALAEQFQIFINQKNI